MLWIELGILLLCIVVGARLGGISLDTVSGLGLAFFMFVLGLPPGSPVIGYERATELAAEVYRTNKGILEFIREEHLLTEAQITEQL
jgi:hypothetical protein